MKTLFLDDEQCVLLREMLDLVPMTPRHLPLIVDLLQRIPEPAAAATSPGSAPSAVSTSPTGGGFQLRRLPHGEGV